VSVLEINMFDRMC